MTNKTKSTTTKTNQENIVSIETLNQAWGYYDSAMDDLLFSSDTIANEENLFSLLVGLNAREYISFKLRLYKAYKNIQRINELIANFEDRCNPI